MYCNSKYIEAETRIEREEKNKHKMHQAKRTVLPVCLARELFFITILQLIVIRANMHTVYFIACYNASDNYVIVQIFVCERIYLRGDTTRGLSVALNSKN